MMRVIAYILRPDFEDYIVEWVKSKDMNSVCCPNPKCYRLLVDDYFNMDFTFKKKQSDIYFIAQGGIYLVSLRFKSVIEENMINGVEFINLPKVKDYYLLNMKNVLKVDMTQVDKSEICPDCGKQISTSMSIGYRDFRAKKVIRILETKNEIIDGIYRSDIKFTEHLGYSYDIILGTQTKQKFEKYKLKGLLFHKIIPTDEEV